MKLIETFRFLAASFFRRARAEAILNSSFTHIFRFAPTSSSGAALIGVRRCDRRASSSAVISE